MRTVVACFVLAAAIATPGIVVAALAGQAGPGEFNIVTGQTSTGSGAVFSSGPINPKLRPTVNEVKAALAAKGVKLVVVPLGGEAAQAAELGPHTGCPVFIVFRLRGTSGLEADSGFCSSRGAVEHGNVAITYVPASLGPTIRQALSR